MSYILDALKKADAERARDAAAVPDLHAQADAEVRGQRAPAWAGSWPLLGAAAVLIALALWAWTRFGGPAPEAPLVASPAPTPRNELPAAPVALPAAPPVAAVSPAPSATPPLTRLPQAPLAPAVKPALRSVAATATAASTAAPARTPTLAELAPDLRGQLPALAVGGSVYSPNASSRIVILNGQVFREGDKPVDGLVVERIGLKSTLLVFRGTRFELKH